MQRVTISLDDELAEAFEQLMQRRGYANRSEAVRDLVRKELGAEVIDSDSMSECVAVLSYVYNHHERQLATRLTELQHIHHALTLATMHAHLDHHQCVETVFLRGPVAKVRPFAEAIASETGVHHGNVHIISVAPPEPTPKSFRKPRNTRS